MQISVSKLKSGDPLTRLKFVYCADTQMFKKSFSAIGVEVTSEKDLETLAKMVELGYDKEGKLTNKNGQPIKFDIIKLIDAIPVRHNALNNCSIKLID